MSSPPHAPAPGRGDRRALPLVSALFFASGAAGLVYQVLWMRSLGLFFGSDMYGVSIILSAFMGGLALGSALGGRLAERLERPLLAYGLAEAAIGLFALPFAGMLAALDPLLHDVYASADGAWRGVYQGVRMAMAGGVLLIPTTLMGATLPLVLRHFVQRRDVLGESAAHFYALNTLGALCGTLLAGFVLLPQLGMAGATLCAASLNLAIGAICSAVGWSARVPRGAASAPGVELDPLPGLDAARRQRVARAALLAFGLSGFGSFALEVLWTRILLITFSATVYSFTATLACFLFGIFLGSRLVSREVDRHPDPVALFARLELGVGASVAALALLLHALPGAFGRLLGLMASVPGIREQALVASTLIASFPLLVVPATLLGATFPVALRIYTTNVARVGSRTGSLYASNTVGAVLGSLTAGLLLIPTAGALTSLVGVAMLFIAIGLGLARAGADGVRASERRPLAVAGATALLCGALALALPYRVTLNFDQAKLQGAELLFHAEGVQNTIDVVRSSSGATSLVIGGNVEADDGEQQRRHFVLKGHLPLLLHREPRRVLVVGLGMGITLQATARHPGLERIDVIELSPEILAAQEHLAAINGDVVNDPLVHVRIDDGRLFMKLTDERFDMITADPIHPKISRVGYLYTREYYRSIRERLREGGVVCQWMPVYQIAPRRLRSAVATFLDVFPHATLWYVEGHALLVAKLAAEPVDFADLSRRFAAPAVREDLGSIGIHSPEALLSHLLMGPDELRAWLAEDPPPLNTDDHPYLEYFVPGDLFHPTGENVRTFLPHLSDPARFARDLPVDAAARLAASSAEREARLLAR